MIAQNKLEYLTWIAFDAELEGYDFVIDFSDEELRIGYNGIGPEWFPPELRSKVTDILAIFEPAALVHDMRNVVSDGTREKFDKANDEFLHNCLKLANYHYPWYSLRRYRARAAAFAMYEFVSSPGGWRAWMDAAEARVAK